LTLYSVNVILMSKKAAKSCGISVYAPLLLTGETIVAAESLAGEIADPRMGGIADRSGGRARYRLFRPHFRYRGAGMIAGAMLATLHSRRRST
jgi:hypothetical protein